MELTRARGRPAARPAAAAEARELARCRRHQRGVLSCSHPMRALNATWATCMARAGPGGLPKRERLEHGGGHRDDHSAQHCSQRLPAGWRPLRARTTVSRAVCATLVAVGLANGRMRRGSVWWCQ